MGGGVQSIAPREARVAARTLSSLRSSSLPLVLATWNGVIPLASLLMNCSAAAFINALAMSWRAWSLYCGVNGRTRQRNQSRFVFEYQS